MKKNILFGGGFLWMSIAVLVLFAGCTHDHLYDIPVYGQVDEEEYKRMAPIEIHASAYKEADALLRASFAAHHYKILSDSADFDNQYDHNVRIVRIIEDKTTVLDCEDGYYLDNRMIVVVRAPGIVYFGQLFARNGAQPRFFQAYSRRFSGSRRPTPEECAANKSEVLKNLFSIAEFRDALEALDYPSAEAEGVDPQDLWGKSQFYQKYGMGREAVYYAYLAERAGNADAAAYLASFAIGNEIFMRNSDLFALVKKVSETNDDPAFKNHLGLLYLNGIGVKKDRAEAFRIFQTIEEVPTAQYNIGLCYENGWGVDADKEMALQWYQKAAENGYAAAEAKVQKLSK
ncbi:MAG: sel1 repeat family protein [Victivallaceae bacterium]|nr:sel1 repeat family protein [Victivallaceae bacterium]